MEINVLERQILAAIIEGQDSHASRSAQLYALLSVIDEREDMTLAAARKLIQYVINSYSRNTHSEVKSVLRLALRLIPARDVPQVEHSDDKIPF